LLYKDEVRELGIYLGLEEKLIYRHPFPGPGLGVRCLCSNMNILEEFKTLEEEVNKKLNNFLELELKKNEEFSKIGLKAKIIPIKSVGVQGDGRSYKYPCFLYSKDISKFNLNLFENISTKITNTIFEINRILVLIEEEDIIKLNLEKN